ncbi:hypothetical protein PQX77_018251 [Marasmius sp. AFHP31]|nr:hypothetical protein PQX77_018251 [Marasmius sp. AFHP31]
MSSTKTETKGETKTETPKGKERAAPGERNHRALVPCQTIQADRMMNKEVTMGGADAADQRWKTWCDLPHRLREDFKPHNREGTAERKLDTIQQTGELTDIDEFNKVFNELAADSEHNYAGLRWFYKQGINPVLKTIIDKFKVVPTTLNGWQKAAIQKYNDWIHSRAKEKAWGRRKQTTSTTTTTMIRAANTSNAQQAGNTASTSSGRLTQRAKPGSVAVHCLKFSGQAVDTSVDTRVPRPARVIKIRGL